MTENDAKFSGFASLTVPYKKSEYWMLDNVVRDMKGCHFAVVEVANGIEVWRHKSELL